MSNVVEWYLPEDLLHQISNRLFSKVELLRFRGISKTWRNSATSISKRFPNHHKRHCRRLLPNYRGRNTSLSPAAFYRVVLSSCPDKGWLIKTQDVEVSRKQKLIFPLSRRSIKPSDKTLDLLEFTVSEIRQSYDVQHSNHGWNTSYDFLRVVLVENKVFVVNKKKEIWWCKSDDSIWARIMDEEVKHFSDIVLHKGHVYALDLNGAIWWISLSELQIYQFGPSTPMDYFEIDHCKEKRLVEFCGEDLFVIHRFTQKFVVKKYEVERTIGFKVFKMDEELVKWVDIKSLGNKTIVMATDSCFSILASEYYGCLENCIYFTDEEGRKKVKVFKLGDGSIINMFDSSSDQSCFQMLNPPFL